MLVLAYCGLRWSELAALRVERVDLLRRRMTLAEAMRRSSTAGGSCGARQSLTRRGRSPIPRFLVEPLADHLAGKDSSDLVFATRNGAPLRNRKRPA